LLAQPRILYGNMSKLYDQLKNAAKARAEAAASAEPSQNSLLSSALKRAQAEPAAPQPPQAVPAVPVPLRSLAAVAALGIVAGALLGGGFMAWRDTTPAAPLRDGLKLDYRLDLSRTGGAARSSLPDRGPSR